MVGGTVAVNAYTGINRPTHDLDIFCKASDYPKILEVLQKNGYKTEVTDERWLAKIKQGQFFADIIFGASNASMPVTDDWFRQSQKGKVFDVPINFLPPTELIWSKAFVHSRRKYDGADVAHLILICAKEINWLKLLRYMDMYWEVLLMHVLNFRFIYPSEREKIPRKIFDELLNRLQTQAKLPTSHEKVCRGRLLSPGDYEIDVHEWGYTDLIGWKYERPKA